MNAANEAGSGLVGLCIPRTRSKGNPVALGDGCPNVVVGQQSPVRIVRTGARG